jgi:hypothetical protein
MRTLWSGLIDDVRIYNQPLSAEEIAALAQQATRKETKHPEYSKGWQLERVVSPIVT